jgi:cell volume regulation protein A
VLVRELRLPPGAAVSLLVRGGEGSVPGPDTRLQRGDQLLVVTTSLARAEAERRLRAVGRAGRLAGWLGETGRRRD